MHDADNSGYNFTAYTNGNTGTNADRGFVVGGSTYGSYSGWIWNRENGPLYFGTNNTYRMTISSAGNLQIGSSLSNTGTQTVRISSAVGTSGTVVDALHIDCRPDTEYDKGVALSFGLKYNTYGEYTSRIVHYGYVEHTRASKLQLQTHSGTYGVWNTGILINDVGNVGIGTTAPTQTLSVYGTAGKTGGGSWSSFSDIRLKTDIKVLINATELIAEYPKPIAYKWKNPEEHENQIREVIGLSAQDLEEVNPELVSEGVLTDSRDAELTDGKAKAIYFSNEFFALQLGAVQELIARVEALESENKIIKKELCKQNGASPFCK